MAACCLPVCLLVCLPVALPRRRQPQNHSVYSGFHRLASDFCIAGIAAYSPLTCCRNRNGGGPSKRVGRSRCFSRLLSSMKSGWMQFCSPERPHCIQCRCPDVQLSDSHSWKILQMTCLPQAPRATEGRAYGHYQPGECPVPKAHFYLYVTFIT